MATAYVSSAFSRTAGPGAVPRAPAEVVLETSTVAHAQEVAKRTLREVEEKANELRALVGNSYRNLINSADTIVAMATTSNALVTSINTLKGTVDVLQRLQAADAAVAAGTSGAQAAPPVPGTPRGRRRAREEDDDYLWGCRVKYVLDTPELLWGLLEDGEYAAAADRHASCGAVLSFLHADPEVAHLVATRFPVVNTASPAVEQFGNAIRDAAKQQLRCFGATPAAVADCALAVALVDALPAHSALGALLDARRAALRDVLVTAQSDVGAHPPGSPGAVTAATQGLLAAVTAAQAAVCHAGELFLEAPGVRPPPSSRVTSSLPFLTSHRPHPRIHATHHTRP